MSKTKAELMAEEVEVKAANAPDANEVAAAAAPSPPAVQDDARGRDSVPVARIKAESYAYLGVSAGAVAGALTGLPDDEEITLDAARKRVDTWLNAPAGEEN